MDVGPIKYFIKDLLNKPTPISVWIQGTIEQSVGNDILIISDGTGKAKITKCGNAIGVINKTGFRKGMYCCIIGTAVKTKGLPEVQTTKYLDLSNYKHLQNVWKIEVEEANLYLQGKLLPVINK